MWDYKRSASYVKWTKVQKLLCRISCNPSTSIETVIPTVTKESYTMLKGGTSLRLTLRIIVTHRGHLFQRTILCQNIDMITVNNYERIKIPLSHMLMKLGTIYFYERQFCITQGWTVE